MSLSMNISSLENRRMQYPAIESQEFLPLKEYIHISKKIISFYCKGKKSLAKALLSSDDAISSVTEQLIMGDWRWKPEYVKKIYDDSGNILETKVFKISRRSYRHKCGVWAIKSYLDHNRTIKKNKRLPSLDFEFLPNSNEPTTLYDVIEDNVVEVDDSVKKKVTFLLNNSKLSEAQKKTVQLYFLEGLTLEEVGVKLGITKQGAQQNVQRALSNMRLTAGL